MTNTSSLQVVANAKKRIISIQACRGIAAMLVVLVHLSNVERKDFSSHLTGILAFGNLGVDLFFVISGVVISSVTVGKFSSPRKAWTYLKRRLFRIYPIYWVYSAVFLAGYLYNPLWFNNSTGHRVDILESFLLIPTHSRMVIMQAWTLSYEMYFYLMFFLILLFIPERFAPVFLCLWGGCIVAANMLFTLPRWPVLGLLTGPLILEFLAGCLIFHVHRRTSGHPLVGFVLLPVSLVWLSWIIFFTYHEHGGSQMWIQNSLWARPATYGLFAALFLLGLMELERSAIFRFAKPFESVGDWSYSIYLAHLAIVEIVGRTISHFAVRIPFSILSVVVVSLPLVIIVGYLSFTFIERPLMTALNRHARKAEPLLRHLAPTSPNP